MSSTARSETEQGSEKHCLRARGKASSEEEGDQEITGFMRAANAKRQKVVMREGNAMRQKMKVEENTHGLIFKGGELEAILHTLAEDVKFAIPTDVKFAIPWAKMLSSLACEASTASNALCISWDGDGSYMRHVLSCEEVLRDLLEYMRHLKRRTIADIPDSDDEELPRAVIAYDDYRWKLVRLLDNIRLLRTKASSRDSAINEGVFTGTFVCSGQCENKYKSHLWVSEESLFVKAPTPGNRAFLRAIAISSSGAEDRTLLYLGGTADPGKFVNMARVHLNTVNIEMLHLSACFGNVERTWDEFQKKGEGKGVGGKVLVVHTHDLEDLDLACVTTVFVVHAHMDDPAVVLLKERARRCSGNNRKDIDIVQMHFPSGDPIGYLRP